MTRIRTDPQFEELLPPLSTEEFEALKADIAARGVLEPIVVDEDGVVLDGHHRFKADPNAPTRQVLGLTLDEKKALAIRSNLARRNLSPDQKRELLKRQKGIAKGLRAAGKTQAEVAVLLGVGRKTVDDWEPTRVSNGGSAIPNSARSPDNRVKIAPQARARVVAERDAGKTQEQLAADLGVSRGRVSQIEATERAQQRKKADMEQKAKAIRADSALTLGDFRTAADSIPDETVDLIFTDPPYNEEAIPLYAGLAILALRVLKPGGICMTYAGHSHLPEVMAAMLENGVLRYGWTCAILHSGGDLRFRNLKIQNHWKPILLFYKEPRNPWWDWFVDVTSGGKEKGQHEWQQAESEAAHFVKALSPANGIVLDPFAGSGTTLVAAKKLGRRYLGFEIAKDAYQKAQIRLSEAAVEE